MTKTLRVAAAAALISVVATVAAAQAPKKPKAAAVPGEDEYRSATGYTVAVMEHCKAINKLAQGTGPFNVALAREHAAEITRNASSASRHLKGYVSALDAGRREQVTVEFATQSTNEDAATRFAAQLGDTLKSSSPDRKAVADTVTSLYLAERELLDAHKLAGKTLGIRAATPPRKATPRKPKSPKTPPGDDGTGEDAAAMKR